MKKNLSLSCIKFKSLSLGLIISAMSFGAMAQSYTTFTPANQNCGNTTLTTLPSTTASDGVIMIPSFWNSSTVYDTDLDVVSINDCSLFPYPILYPTCSSDHTFKRNPMFCYANNEHIPAGGYVGGSGAKPIYITKATTANTASAANPVMGETSNVVIDFTTGNLPLGLSFKIADIDNPRDRFAVKIYSGGSLVSYNYNAGLYVIVSTTDYADASFTGSGSGTATEALFRADNWYSVSGTSTTWDNGVLEVAVVDPLLPIDSVVISQVAPNNANNANPAWAVGDFRWTSNDALPITLLSFDAYKEGRVAQLKWATASEHNNKGFEIMRSTDGKDWTTIGFVNTQAENGNSSMKLDYTFTDNNPADGKNLYRLKQTDFDGTYDYSRIKVVYYDKTNGITLYPNPAEGNVRIKGLNSNSQIRIYDVTGRLRKSISTDQNLVDIALDNIEPGIYSIHIIDAFANSTIQKFVKQ